MPTFLTSVVLDLLSKNDNLTNLKIILPSKRAGVFFKEIIKREAKTNLLLPSIISIEEFITDTSQINKIDSVQILFDFYKIYLENTSKNKQDGFDRFINWASTLLQDFNEIDRHLIDPKYIFNYLKDINRIENWFLENSKETILTKNYISFFDSFEKYYSKLNNYLLEKKIGYQGLQYKEAAKKIENYITENKSANKTLKEKLIFVGFNALNKSEEFIIQKLVDNNIASIYFDIDQFYIDENLPASNFIKKYKAEWSYFQKNKFNWIDDSFQKKKNISIIGIPKNVSQIKYASEILQNLNQKSSEKKQKFENTAYVLANENLLQTTLNSLPKDVENVNITMGYPLKNIITSNLFTHLFKLYQNNIKLGKSDSFYFKDVIAILNHPHIKNIFAKYQLNLVEIILQNNYIFLTKTNLIKLVASQQELIQIIKLIFNTWNSVENTLNNYLKLLEIINEKYTNNHLYKEYLYRFHTLFQQLKNLNEAYGYITDLESLQQVYNQLLNNENLSFKGEPLSGLQIMGMLETRVLDFETVIITSMNEGFLPAGKSNNSFIPFDVKREVGLPTYHEKDAIFSYHFFHLIQRAKTIYILYNTETDDFGSGEQSRFVTQLEILQNKLPNHILNKTIVSPNVINEVLETKLIEKSNDIVEQINQVAKKGFSPTTLTSYINNPIDFYKQKILKIKQVNEIEETVASNTLGTIIHKTLEELYIPYKGKYLLLNDIKKIKKEVSKTIKKYFKAEYENGDITTGKNLIIFEIAKQYIQNFLNQENQLLKNGKQLKIIALEKNIEIDLSIKGIKFPIKVKGQIDRIDELDGAIRIIDYKTGSVEQRQLSIKNWELISTDYIKYSKSFQVLLYAYMYAKSNQISFDDTIIESGVISFKKLKVGFMKVNNTAISQTDIDNFEKELKNLITEICNKEIPFKENENRAY